MKLSKIEKLQMNILRFLKDSGEQNTNDIGLYCKSQLGYNPREYKISNTHHALRPLIKMKAVDQIPQPHPKPYRYSLTPNGEIVLLYLESMENYKGRK